MADVRTVKTAVGATMVEMVWLSRGGSRGVEHRGWAQDGAGVGVLKGCGAQRLAANPAVPVGR